MIILLFFLFIVAVILAYLLFWPVPIRPMRWQAPKPPLASGSFTENTSLARAKRLPAGGSGPEDIAIDDDGRIYTGLADGRIMRMNPDGSHLEQFTRTGGRPLGLAFAKNGSLLIADAEEGLLAADQMGSITVLVNQFSGRELKYVNNLAVAADGTIYFSESSDRFCVHEMAEEILESRPNGRIFTHDPHSGETNLFWDNLFCPNGLAIHPERGFLLVSETTRYRVRRMWLDGPQAGREDIFIENLPGLPDNLHYDGHELFWLTLILPRIKIVDKLAALPFLRKIPYRLPESIKPTPQRHGYVLGLNAEGRIIHNFQDPSGIIAWTSGAITYQDELFVGSFNDDYIARLPLKPA